MPQQLRELGTVAVQPLLSQTQERAAYLIAMGEHTNTQIAGALNISVRNLHMWRLNEQFSLTVAEYRASLREAISEDGIRSKANRLQSMNDRHMRLMRIIEQRAQDPAMQNIPGGATGLLVRKLVKVGTGRDAEFIEEYTVDAALLAEMRHLEKQAAIELGDITDKRQVTVVYDDPDAAESRTRTTFDFREYDRLYSEVSAIPGVAALLPSGDDPGEQVHSSPADGEAGDLPDPSPA